MVIEGEIELLSADKVHFLRKDDALCFDGSLPHTCRTEGEKDARLVMPIEKIPNRWKPWDSPWSAWRRSGQ